ncbi:MAG: cohesin domain-containing protein, partial [Saprospiraceae bacterium]|nr:cohesin domain-containing protein [Saprospiraceae bacterium]
MNFRFNSYILGALFSLFASQTNAQGFSVHIDTVNVQAGQEVCVPVRAKGFNDIISFQYALTWDPQVLQYVGVQNIHLPGLSASSFGFSPPNDLYVGWASLTGLCVSIPDDEILYELCFLAIGPAGSSASIVVGNPGIPSAGNAEAYNCLSEDIYVEDESGPGLVTIEAVSGTSGANGKSSSSFQMFPNPTQSSTSVMLHSETRGKANLLVTDAAG